MCEETTQLVERCLREDERAMRSLMDRYLSRVFALCFRMLGHRQDAEDATQETFVRVFRSLKSWDSSRAFEPWLLAIAGNRCRTRISRRAKHPRSVELEGEDLIETCDSQNDLRQLTEEIQQALQSVTPRYAEAFRYFHEHGMSYQQIADVMEVPLGTIKTWVRRGRLQLVELLTSRGAIEETQHAVRDV